MQGIIKKAENTHNLKKEEIVKLLKTDTEELFRAADRVRKEFVGDEVHLRALLEFSNICKCDCKYCGLRCSNKNAERYRLSKEQILDLAKKAVNYGYRTIVMQSGEDKYYTAEILAEIIKEIKSLKPTPAVTLSIGERSFDEYKMLKDAGADRFLLRIETTDKNLYKKLHPNMNFKNRIRCLKDLKTLGYELGTGSLVGLPNQTIESIADDILFFKKIGADMIGVGPFIPHKDTPLGKEDGGTFELARKVIAIVRLLMPDINIPATTAMETLNPAGRIIALQSGANVVMPNATEGDYRKKYEIYPGKICINDSPAECRKCIENKIKAIGRTISEGQGNSKHYPLTLPSPAGRGKTKQAKNLRKNLTPQERTLWNKLRNRQINNLKFKRQAPIGDYIVDFLCLEKMLVVEVDGGQHNQTKNIQYDQKRTEYLNNRGFKVLRFWNNDIDNNIEGVIEKILTV